jgi:hypothetical protein
MPTLYEVHTLKGGTWQIDSTYPQRDPAIEVAKTLYGEKRFDAIKVVKDDFDPKTNKGKEMVIYDSSKPQAEKKAPPTKEEAKAAAAAPEKKADVDFHGHGKAAAKKSENSLVKAILWLVALLVGGIAVLYGLAQLAAVLGRL